MTVEGLTVRFGDHVAVDDVSFTVPHGGVLGLVGESGSGKSTVAKAVVGLVAPDRGRITGAARRQLVFQDPYASLNPRMTVGTALTEAAKVGGAERRGRPAEVRRLLGLVSLDAEVAGRYPRELSGGQRQRVAIARALAVHPDVLIADEITSALDVSVQGAVLNLVRELRAALGLSMLFISHNLAVVRYVSDTVAVMRAGRIVEHGPVDAVLGDPSEDYTRELLAAVPRL
ncbi:ABC transporter ATP-binding protein [Actinomadura rubrisoli]|uniref:ABC transporter ATP-binding protein n=1 Tax=Actinomadura rubrisoli TaxID=2530368 RepID=A0A4R5BJW7_9ACTN|nr:ABC transporter ATP-binding protein [Actinomadura rubrisoli]